METVVAVQKNIIASGGGGGGHIPLPHPPPMASKLALHGYAADCNTICYLLEHPPDQIPTYATALPTKWKTFEPQLESFFGLDTHEFLLYAAVTTDKNEPEYDSAQETSLFNDPCPILSIDSTQSGPARPGNRRIHAHLCKLQKQIRTVDEAARGVLTLM